VLENLRLTPDGFWIQKPSNLYACQGYAPDSIEIEPNSDRRSCQSRFNALPLEVVTAYWLTQVGEGKKQALILLGVGATD